MELNLKILIILSLTVFACRDEDNQIYMQENIETTDCQNSIWDTDNHPEVFKVVEEPPYFSGCEGITEKAERKKCSDEKVEEFISQNLIYPEEAKSEGIEGLVVIKYIVNTEGCVVQIEIVRDIGGGCGEEAIRITELMPKWNPGKQGGVPVNVQVNLPIKFKL